MSGFYPRASVEIKVGTIGANVNNFVSKVQVEKRLNELDVLKINIKTALELIRDEEQVLNATLEIMKN